MEEKFTNIEGIEWMDETVEKIPSSNKLYRMMCFMVFRRRLTYKELYALIVKLNKKKLGEEEARKVALVRVFAAYKYNNNYFPKYVRF